MRIIILAVILVFIGAGGYWAYTHYSDSDHISVEPASTASEIVEDVKFLTALMDTTPDMALADEGEIRALASAMNDIADITFGAIEDEDAGVVAKDVVITSKEMPDFGVRIKELRVWGVNAQDAMAALAGDVEEALAAERIDARGIEWFGLDKLTQTMMDTYLDTASDTLAAIGEPSEARDELVRDVFQQEIERYDFAVGRLIVDSLTFFAPLPPAEIDAEDSYADLMSGLQMFARWNLAAGGEALVAYDVTANMASEQAGQKTDFAMSVALMGYRNWRRGDLDVGVIRGMAYDMTNNFSNTTLGQADSDDTDPNDDAPVYEMKMSGGIDEVTVSDSNLSKLFEYLALGKWPPMSETDVLSLGVWRSTGERYTLGGKPFYSVKDTYADLSHFYWLMPTKMEIRQNEISYSIEGMLDYTKGLMSATLGAESSAEEMETIAASIEILKKYDLAAPVMNFEMTGTWDPKSGEAQSTFGFDIRDFGRVDYGGEVLAPTFGAFAAMAPKEGQEIEWEDVLDLTRSELALKNLSLIIADEGGVEKSFALAVDFANLAPEGDPSAAMLQNADPADLRLSSAAMIRLSAPQLAQAFPPAKEYLTALADFIQKGGKIRAAANPPTPVTLDTLQNAEAEIAADPALLAEMLGLRVTHEPAEK